MYVGTVDRWWDVAGVRTQRRLLHDPAGPDGMQWFPASLVPLARHPVLADLPPAATHQLLARHLLDYLQFTADFEVRVVNVATHLLATGQSGFDVTASARKEALQIYCDEAFHALSSVDVIAQVEAAAGVAHRVGRFERFVERLDRTVEVAPPELRNVARILLVVVFETLVTATLTAVPDDPAVVPVVRQIVADHAHDERRHHAYFARLFPLLWAELSGPAREKLAPLLPDMIVRCLEPDLLARQLMLEAVGVPSRQARAAVDDCHPREEVVADIRATAAATIHLFERHGLLEHAATYDAFALAGLVGADEEAGLLPAGRDHGRGR
jgi:hypothetical protein